MSEALRLADLLVSSPQYSGTTIWQAAAELRRLHEENQQLRDQNTELDAACAKLEALNAELVEALRSLVAATEGVSTNDYNEEAHDIAVSRARAALAKVGESK